MQYVLGINSVYHESSACLLRDGEIVAAIEEERLNRVKHAKMASVDNPNELPLLAIARCLEKAGIEAGRVDALGFSINPRRRLKNQEFDDVVTPDSWGSAAGEQRFFHQLSAVPDQLRELGFTGEFAWVDHHLCHAASAYYPSPFDEAAILTVDGIGEESSTSFGHGRGKEILIFQEIEYPSSLGFLWEKLSKFLGFTDYDACKVMALAAYGSPESKTSEFERLVTLLPEGKFRMDGRGLRFRVEEYEALEQLFGVKRRGRDEEIRPVYCDIVASLQRLTDRVMLHMVEHLHRETKSDNLCVAGGVALNCVSNSYIHEHGPFTNLFIQPAAHDAGTAVGAATHVWHALRSGERRSRMTNAYLGPEFSEEEMRAVLDAEHIVYERQDEIEKVVAGLLNEGQIVGWFQGAMEFGPRALGNRSLLADPRDPRMREILNLKVKHREPFRPFASSALAEEAPKWFHLNKATPAAEFMLVAHDARESVRSLIPAVLHVDGTCRIQIVRKEANAKYHALITEFYRLTGVPLLLNTSFNDDEPIVCTVQDALNTFSETLIDYLAIGDFLIDRRKQPHLSEGNGHPRAGNQ
jgi:carbamoyltransferase